MISLLSCWVWSVKHLTLWKIILPLLVVCYLPSGWDCSYFMQYVIFLVWRFVWILSSSQHGAQVFTLHPCHFTHPFSFQDACHLLNLIQVPVTSSSLKVPVSWQPTHQGSFTFRNRNVARVCLSFAKFHTWPVAVESGRSCGTVGVRLVLMKGFAITFWFLFNSVRQHWLWLCVCARDGGLVSGTGQRGVASPPH